MPQASDQVCGSTKKTGAWLSGPFSWVSPLRPGGLSSWERGGLHSNGHSPAATPSPAWHCPAPWQPWTRGSGQPQAVAQGAGGSRTAGSGSGCPDGGMPEKRLSAGRWDPQPRARPAQALCPLLAIVSICSWGPWANSRVTVRSKPESIALSSPPPHLPTLNSSLKSNPCADNEHFTELTRSIQQGEALPYFIRVFHLV